MFVLEPLSEPEPLSMRLTVTRAPLVRPGLFASRADWHFCLGAGIWIVDWRAANVPYGAAVSIVAEPQLPDCDGLVASVNAAHRC
jgi:hypothetical protein